MNRRHLLAAGVVAGIALAGGLVVLDRDGDVSEDRATGIELSEAIRRSAPRPMAALPRRSIPRPRGQAQQQGEPIPPWPTDEVPRLDVEPWPTDEPPRGELLDE